MSARDQQIRDLKGTIERRGFAARLELRETAEGGCSFSGYAATFGVPYEVGDFTETIERGAFKRTLTEQPDVVFLVNHEGLPLARTTSGTLTLEEDEHGLRVRAELEPSDADVQRLKPKLQRGDLSEMSFAFRCTADEWNDGRTLRTVRGVSLHHGDVSIVTTGANPDTTASMRSRQAGRGWVLDNTTRAAQELALMSAQTGLPVCGPTEDAATRRQRASLIALRR
jgi:HK97 family phage prohead protease